MPLDFITHNGKEYPSHEAIGGASLWIRPLAQHYCIGKGLDIGYSKEKWMLPGAIGIEPAIDPKYSALALPGTDYDFIHSSHCLEHVKENWCNVLDYWLSKIKAGGILFLYLPHKSQSYWNVEYNRKHVHEFGRRKIGRYLRSLGHKVWVSGVDFNHSFVVIVEKMDKPTVDFNFTVKTENKHPFPFCPPMSIDLTEYFSDNVPDTDKMHEDKCDFYCWAMNRFQKDEIRVDQLVSMAFDAGNGAFK